MTASDEEALLAAATTTTAAAADDDDHDANDGDSDGPDNPYVRALFAPARNNDNNDDDDDDDDSLITHDVHVFHFDHDNDDDDDGNDDGHSLTIHYHLAFLARGHGNSLWNSSVCIAQHLLNATASTTSASTKNQKREKLLWLLPSSKSALNCIEFGAGAALPSLSLMAIMAGATTRTNKNSVFDTLLPSLPTISSIVITDLVDTDGLTFEALDRSIQRNGQQWNMMSHELEVPKIHLVPHIWGESVEPMLAKIGSSSTTFTTTSSATTATTTTPPRFDLAIASDCIYNPTYHRALLESVKACLDLERSNIDSEGGTGGTGGGMLVVGYSFHNNVPPKQVEAFFDMAQNDFDLSVVQSITQPFPDGQSGIGSSDPERGTVYLKVLMHKDFGVM